MQIIIVVLLRCLFFYKREFTNDDEEDDDDDVDYVPTRDNIERDAVNGVVAGCREGGQTRCEVDVALARDDV